MSYERYNWAGEEIISANRLNHIEMGIEEIDKNIFSVDSEDENESIQEQINSIENDMNTINGNFSGVQQDLISVENSVENIEDTISNIDDNSKFNEFRIQTLNGRPIMRHRELISNGTINNRAMQNGIVYSNSLKTGSNEIDYSMTAAVKYIYFWETVSYVSDSTPDETYFCTYVVYTNELTGNPNISQNDLLANRRILTYNNAHGGPFVLKKEGNSTYLYSIVYTVDNKGDIANRYLFKIDITTPNVPSISNVNGTQLNLGEVANLIGWVDGEDNESGYWLAISDKKGGYGDKNAVYKIKEDFSELITPSESEYNYWFVLDNPTDILTQDIKYDPKRKLIYQTTAFPNIINIYNMKGKIIFSIKFPDQHMSYVNCGEMEWTDIHDNMIYCGGLCNVGVAGDLRQEYNAWGCNLDSLNAVRGIQNTVTGRRDVNVRGDEGNNAIYKFNPPYPTLNGKNLNFAYAEDAFNYIRDFQGGEVTFTGGEYKYSFQVPCNCELEFTGAAGSNKVTHPFVILKNVVCNIRGFQNLRYTSSSPCGSRKLSGTDNAVKYQVYIDPGAKVTVVGITDIGKATAAKYSIVVDRAELKITQPGQLKRTLCWHGSIMGQAHIMDNIHCVGSYIDCRWWDIRYSNTQKVDATTIIRSPMVWGQSDNDLTPEERPLLSKIVGDGGYSVPTECIVFPQYGLLNNIFIYNQKGFSSNATTTVDYIDSSKLTFNHYRDNTNYGYTYVIRKYREKINIGSESFVAYKYKIFPSSEGTPITNNECYPYAGNNDSGAYCVILPMSKK